MKTEPAREQTKFWSAADLGEVDLLKATYITHSFSRHTHEGYVFGVIERGAEAFYYRGAMHYAPAGSVVVINPDEVHTGHAGHETGWTYRTLYPEAELVRQVVAEMSGRPGHLPYFPEPVIYDASLAYLVRQLHHTLETSESAIERETMFRTVLAQFIERHAADPPSLPLLGVEHEAVRQIQDYLENHYAENVSLQDLAGVTGFSPFYLTRVFRQATGLPPHAYLNQVRIERAKTLLLPEQPIAHIAAEIGFVDQSHLTRHFKRIVGVTPGQYAQKDKNIQDDSK